MYNRYSRNKKSYSEQHKILLLDFFYHFYLFYNITLLSRTAIQSICHEQFTIIYYITESTQNTEPSLPFSYALCDFY